jgi:hypothetical protein
MNRSRMCHKEDHNKFNSFSNFNRVTDLHNVHSFLSVFQRPIVNLRMT